jgi:phage terminase small subunit
MMGGMRMLSAGREGSGRREMGGSRSKTAKREGLKGLGGKKNSFFLNFFCTCYACYVAALQVLRFRGLSSFNPTQLLALGTAVSMLI